MGCPENLVIVATRLLVEEVGPWLLSATDVLLSVHTLRVLYLAARNLFRFRRR